jgi:hypothetical protein
MREAEEHVAQLAKNAPLSSRVEVPPQDGIGRFTITMTYNSIDRGKLFSTSRAVRVRKGPIFPKRTFLRGYVQGDLDGMLDRIEQCESPEEEGTVR